MNIFVLYIDHTSDIIFKVILHLEVVVSKNLWDVSKFLLLLGNVLGVVFNLVVLQLFQKENQKHKALLGFISFPCSNKFDRFIP